MLRTQISLTEEEKSTLDRVAARTGRSISSLVREAVDKTYGCERSLEDDLAALRRGYGAWKDRDFTGEEYVERLRTGRRLRELFERSF